MDDLLGLDDGWRSDRVGSALRGENPTVLKRLSAGFAVIGDVQLLPGYAVLISDDPLADRLHELPRPKRLAFLADMDRLGAAVAAVCARRDLAFRRVNYEIQGNQDSFLHAHVIPRYDWEPRDLVVGPAFGYPREHWHHPEHALGDQHDDLRKALIAELERE